MKPFISVKIDADQSLFCFGPLYFIGRNFSIVVHEQVTSIDFNITFTGLLSLATDIGLEFPIIQTDFYGILRSYSIIWLVSNIQLVCQFGGFNLHILLPCFGNITNLYYPFEACCNSKYSTKLILVFFVNN